MLFIQWFKAQEKVYPRCDQLKHSWDVTCVPISLLSPLCFLSGIFFLGSFFRISTWISCPLFQSFHPPESPFLRVAFQGFQAQIWIRHQCKRGGMELWREGSRVSSNLGNQDQLLKLISASKNKNIFGFYIYMLYLQKQIYIFIYIFMHMFIYLFIYAYVYIFIYLYINIYIFIYSYIHIFI